MPDFDPHAPLDAAARAALRDLRGEHKRYQQEKLKMTLADPLDDAPDPAWGPYFREPAKQQDPERTGGGHGSYHQPPYAKAKQLDADHAGGHQWTPTDFKPDETGKWHAVPRERQVGGDHYLGRAMQPWDIIEAWGLDFWEGNCLKYLLRRKPGTDRSTDLRKARHYLDKCIAREEAKT